MVNSILTEWRFRLESGYPKSEADYAVLRDVILEMTDLSEADADQIVRQAQGITEDDPDQAPESKSEPENNSEFTDAASFEQYINHNFKVEGQVIIGIRSMYNEIINHPDSASILMLIKNPGELSLKPGAVPIRGTLSILYDIIQDTIKIPNGDWSELWFAIAFNGRVRGAVATDSGLEADIEVDDQLISLKNFNKITFDFGALSPAGTELLNEFLEISKLLTGQSINKSRGARQINDILDFLDNEHVESQIRNLIEMSETTDILLIRNIGNNLKKFYTLSDNLDTMIHSFCHIVDTMLKEKILTVDWWGLIVKSNRTLFLETANDIYTAAKCKNDRLSPAIANFHQNHLSILGSQLSTKVTQKSQD